MNFGERLSAEWFLRNTEEVASELIGKILIREDADGMPIGGRIVETEAYLPESDQASHSFCGKTKRNAPMFEKGGTIYIFRSYGIHYCFNIVTEAEGIGAAVLLRALEPLHGIELMKQNRQTEDIFRLCKGPGNLTKAMGMEFADNFKSIESSNYAVFDDGYKCKIGVSQRIGISKSVELQLRYFEVGSKYVSK